MMSAMSAAEKFKLTPAEYLERERAAEFRSEYVDGEVFAMAGATLNHNLIAMNFGSELRNAFKDRPSVVLGADMKVRVDSANACFYPDLSGRGGPLEFFDDRTDIYRNPEFVIEVLSDSTEIWDRSGKFHRYQTLPSLREYVLVSQNAVAVDVFRRHEAGWLYHSLQTLEDILRLDSVECDVPLAEIYRKVAFESGDGIARRG